MPTYEVVFYLDVRATCEVEADTPEEARKIAETEDWDYTDEDVYESRVHLCHEDGTVTQVYPKVDNGLL